jgi:hypothetical protein
MTARERIAIAPSDRASRQTARPVEVLSAGRVLTFDEVDGGSRSRLIATAPAATSTSLLRNCARGCMCTSRTRPPPPTR